ncbi:MAG: Rpn family recombination-promoting nuclease/putative transposase [Lachnospiraceae bacterium]
MGQKDMTEKLLEDYEDVFADIVNGVVFKGEQRVKTEALRESVMRSQYKADEKLHEQERDIAKYWTDSKVDIALYGLENQTTVDRAMPLRIMGYDGAGYRKQILKSEDEKTEQKTAGDVAEPGIAEDEDTEFPDEKTTQKFVPVITLVLYFGTEHKWRKPQCLKDVIEIPEGLDHYVNDYNIHVVNVAWLTDEEIERFHSDFKLVARFFVEKRKGNIDWMKENKQEIVHVDAILKLLSVMTGDKDYEEIIRNGDAKEVHTMCEVLQYYKNQGRAEGIAQGIADEVLDFLSDLGPVPKDLEEQVSSEKNLDILKRWLKLSARVASIEEFRGKMDSVISDMVVVI